ncbi:tellurite resistance TerB family protein [Phaeovulum vinaykumarii]|uniref:Uncharacterized conserved protein, tellurite resistance protein B (TerB) family n=1 Tax=Phaeovulum vinaykumarii TaxID=407234 RepID=A0A1N7JJR3_9RHOB|nr:TerB family tellurite resistance protein [Phaeovulum vinaykumarii]SIS49559.1 Uncharacterized conserved protein, tellurite resistance protein B (TerB) family [Phaeovulum vinaykumarii]SOB89763.1 uncharacterized tellurite resistance protein B-like protein [Phaeovulum vinaykumarii]
MFGHLLDLILGPTDTTGLARPDAEVALAALLVRVARADGFYDDSEKTRIERLLARRQGLSAEDARALRETAEGVEAEAPDTVRFTRALKDRIAYEDRTQVIEALWEIALADGARSADEDALIRLAAPLLGVSDRDSGLARQRVARRLAEG